MVATRRVRTVTVTPLPRTAEVKHGNVPNIVLFMFYVPLELALPCYKCTCVKTVDVNLVRASRAVTLPSLFMSRVRRKGRRTLNFVNEIVNLS